MTGRAQQKVGKITECRFRFNRFDDIQGIALSLFLELQSAHGLFFSSYTVKGRLIADTKPDLIQLRAKPTNAKKKKKTSKYSLVEAWICKCHVTLVRKCIFVCKNFPDYLLFLHHDGTINISL